MDFSEALALMKQGKKMRRREWVTLKCSPYYEGCGFKVVK